MELNAYEGQVENISLSTQRRRRQASVSLYMRGEMDFPEIVRSLSVMETMWHTCNVVCVHGIGFENFLTCAALCLVGFFLVFLFSIDV